MNFRSLLVGAAALATLSTGARAADAIVVADPEPMEYVRICDVYGAGFFYIPGTETCLKIGGYFRYEIYAVFGAGGGFAKAARFAPTFDVRSDTEIGTVRGFAELEITWRPNDRVANIGGVPTAVTAYGTDVNPLHAYIELQRPNGGAWLFGRTESPFTRFLGYAGPTINDGYYGYRNTQEISYTFTGSNGFGFVAALVDDEDANWTPDAELGFKFARGWGSIGAIAGFDGDAPVGFGFGVKGDLVVNFGSTGSFFKLQAMYTNDPGSSYGFGDGSGTFSVLAGASIAFSQKVSLGVTAQWINNQPAGVSPFFAAVNLPVTVAENFTITPELGYDGPGGYAGVNSVYGILRVQRSF